MLVHELIAALQKRQPNELVVLDVDADDCDSDRNILELSSVGDPHPETFTVFLQGRPLSAASNAHIDQHTAEALK